MREGSRQLIIIALLTALAIVLHALTQNNLMSYVPFPLYLAAVATWLLPKPWRYLLVLGIASELFTTFPPGVLTAVVALPLVVHWLRGRIALDLSFSYALLIALTVLLQLGILIGADLTIGGVHGEVWQAIPWLSASLVWLSLVSVTMITTIFAQSALPAEHRTIISLQGHPIHRLTR